MCKGSWPGKDAGARSQGTSLVESKCHWVATAERRRTLGGQDGELRRQWFGHELGESCLRQLFPGVANSSNSRSGTSLGGLSTNQRWLLLNLGSSESVSE